MSHTGERATHTGEGLGPLLPSIVLPEVGANDTRLMGGGKAREARRLQVESPEPTAQAPPT